MNNLVEMNNAAMNEFFKNNGVDLNNNDFLMLQMMSNIQREQSELRKTGERNKTDIAELKTKMTDLKTDFDKKTSVLGAFGCYGAQLDEITKAIKRKAASVCGGFDTDLFNVFGRSVISDIHSHIHKAMGISKIGQLNMVGYEEAGSDFRTTLKIIDNYYCPKFFFTSHFDHYQRMYDTNESWRLKHGASFERYKDSL